MGKGTRNHIIAHAGRSTTAWSTSPSARTPSTAKASATCGASIPTKRGDVSPELAFNAADPKTPIPHKRVQAVVEKEGDFARPNPELRRGLALQPSSTPTATARSSSKRRCTARCGTRGHQRRHPVHRRLQRPVPLPRRQDRQGALDLRHARRPWGSPLIVDDKVYIGDEDGEVAIFRHSADPTRR